MIGGCVVPVITPMEKVNGDYRVNEEKLVKLVERIVDGGAGIFVLGNAGGFQFLNWDDKKKVIEVCGKYPGVFVGVSDRDVNISVKLAELAEVGEVEAIVVLPKFAEGWEQIVKSCNLPVIFYNNPQICGGRSMELQDVGDFVKRYPGRLAGIKESSGDRGVFRLMLGLQTEMGIAIMEGDATSLVWAKSLEREMLGYKLAGAVPVHANVATQDYVGFLKDPEKYQDKIEKYIMEFPSIPATIGKMVELGMVQADTLDFWNKCHRN